jgi:uncharacterized protein YyaL (SSP411 family)
MLDPATGAFAGSEHGGSDQFADTAAERAVRPPATIDRTVFCHANALAVSALLKAAAVLEQPDWRAQAMATLRFVLGNLFDGQDVHHYWDGTYHLPGLVSDQALLVRALIDASQNTGDADLLLPAEAIAARVLARNKAPTGGFVDALDDRQGPWPARRRNRSILDNATMAESLMRLSFLSRRPEFRREAIAALESFADDYREYGYYVAGYGRAVDLVFYEPLFLTIVGDRDGAGLGARDGRSVGLAVGGADGPSVGECVGRNVGGAVGGRDGRPVGPDVVGARDGLGEMSGERADFFVA